jgi:hypothetical protein
MKMKKCFLRKALLFGAFPFLLSTSVALAEPTRVTYPATLSAEIGGRAGLYSVNFDRVLNDDLAAGIGFGSLQAETSGVGNKQGSAVIPIYLNAYLMRDAGSLYLTAGASLLTSPDSIKGKTLTPGSLQFSSSPFMAHFGLGYEYRSDVGYLVRLTAYGLVSQNIAPWGGISVGYSF